MDIFSLHMNTTYTLHVYYIHYIASVNLSELTLRACAGGLQSLDLCVCRLTSGAYFRPENTVKYLASNGGQNICGVFSETTALQRSSTAPIEGHMPFSCGKHACVFNHAYVVSGLY